MELSRLRRMVRARWWVVAVMAVIGLVVAVAFTRFNNRNIEPRFRAVAAIEFTVTETEPEAAAPTGRGGSGGSSSPAAALVETALAAAEDINATQLENPLFTISSVPAEAKLEFIAGAPSPETAEAVADEMRANYLAVDPTSIDVEAEKARLVEEASTIQARIDELTPPEPEAAPEISPDAQAQIDVLNARVGVITGRVGPLEEEILDETDEAVIADKQAEIDSLTELLAGLKAEIAALTPQAPGTPTLELTPAEALEKSALEARLATISQSYQDLLEGAAATTTELNVPDIAVIDETPEPTDPLLSGLIGLFGGLVAGLGAIVMLDRLQETVWTPSDMAQMPILAEVPQHGGSRVELSPRRYREVRQKGVQSIRSAVLGLYHAAGPSTIGFTGLGTTDEGVSALVLDIGRSLADVGRSVLVVDGQLLGIHGLRDEVSGGATLADIVARDTDDASLTARITNVLDRSVELAPNLVVLPGDPRTVDPVDVLASKSFKALTEAAQQRFDIVMVVGPSALSPFAYVMAGLVAAYVVVTTVGRTRQSHIEKLANQFAGSRSRLIGSVLLGIKPRRGWVPASDLGRGAAPARPAGGDAATAAGALAEPEVEPSLLDRLGQTLASLAGDKSDS